MRKYIWETIIIFFFIYVVYSMYSVHLERTQNEELRQEILNKYK